MTKVFNNAIREWDGTHALVHIDHDPRQPGVVTVTYADRTTHVVSKAEFERMFAFELGSSDSHLMWMFDN